MDMATTDGFSAFKMRCFALAIAMLLGACGGGNAPGTPPSSGTPISPPVISPVTPPVTPPTVPVAPAGPDILTFQGSSESGALAELKGNTRVLQTVALVSDPFRSQVLASVNQPEGNFIVGLDPVSLQTLWSMAAPSYVSRMVIADDGVTMYALLPDKRAVWQIDLGRHAAVRTIAMVDGLSPLALTVRPAHPRTIVVATGNPELVSPFNRLQAYDDGVARSDWLAQGHGSSVALNEIQFISADTLVSLDTQTSMCGRQHLRLGDSGLSVVDSFVGYSACFTDRLETPVAGRLITRQGIEFDPVSLQILAVKPVTHSYDSQFSDAGFGIAHPGLKSYVQLSSDTITRGAYHRVRVDEYPDGAREYMKRHFTVTSDIPLSITGTRPDSIVIDAAAVGAARIVLAVYDQRASDPQVILMGFDLSTSPLLPAWDFSVRNAENGSASGWALRAPITATAYDPDLGRLIGVLPIALGPSGNALAVIQPDTGVVERVIPLAAEPGPLAVSAHGSIAYVGLPGRRMLQKIDLKTGSVLATLNKVLVQALLAKPDDPHTVVVKTVTEQAQYQLTSYTTSNAGFIAIPQVIGDTAGIYLEYLDLMGVSNGGELIGYEKLTSTVVWHLNWNAAGLSIASSQPNSRLGLGGPQPKMAYDRLISSMAVVDVPTAARVTSFSGALWDYVLTSADSVVTLDYDQSNYAASLKWRQAPATPRADGAWDVSRNLTIVDKAFLSDMTRSDSYRADRGAPGQVIIREYATGQFMGAFAPYTGYTYGIKSK